MGKVNLKGVNNIMFAQLEDLSNEDLKGKELEEQLKKSKGMVGLCSQIIKGFKTQIDATRLLSAGTFQEELKDGVKNIIGDIT